MNSENIKLIEEIRDFIAGTGGVSFEIPGGPDARYRWIEETLTKLGYWRLKKADKGLVIRYLMKMSGYSRQQITRLIKQYRVSGRVRRNHSSPATGFSTKYTPEDVKLLAELDELHDTLSGPATRKLCERAFTVFNDVRYERLAHISVSHLYNLRGSKRYKNQRWHYEKTKPKISNIGQRCKPNPDGKPGHIRIDTVHQGDLDGRKGVYHINAVDEVTQFEIVYTVSQISELYLIPALKEMLSAFPFVILGFHSDNGSEYVNRKVARLLQKLLIEFTKSRPRHSNDNALAECKNGAIIRKALGYSHIPQTWAPEVNEFNHHCLNPYINYHRPCFFPEIFIDQKGRQRKKYPHKSMTTPYERFKSLPGAAQYLKPGITFEDLDKVAMSMSDSDAARRLQEARTALFETINMREAA